MEFFGISWRDGQWIKVDVGEIWDGSTISPKIDSYFPVFSINLRILKYLQSLYLRKFSMNFYETLSNGG